MKEFTQEALCQSIELLQLEIKDVKEREKSQEDMYKKIISALKSEIDNTDIAKHIEIINYMHKTEITHLNKRFNTQLSMKEKQIKDMEEKYAKIKDKCRELDKAFREKSKEFDYFSKSEALKMKEMTLKLQSQNDQQKHLLASISPRKENNDKSFSSERKRFKKNIKSLKNLMETERQHHTQKMTKANSTIQKLTTKLAEYRNFKEKEHKELKKGLEKP